LPIASPKQIAEHATDQTELGYLDKSDSAFSEEKPLNAPLADPKQPVSLSLFVAKNVYMPENDRELFLDTVRRRLAKEGFAVTSNGNIIIMGKVTTYEPPNLFGKIFSLSWETGYFNSSWVVLDKDDNQVFKGEFKGTFQAFLFKTNDSLEQASKNVIKILTKTPKH
jgi:hypothetical protein